MSIASAYSSLNTKTSVGLLTYFSMPTKRFAQFSYSQTVEVPLAAIRDRNVAVMEDGMHLCDFRVSCQLVVASHHTQSTL